VREIVIARGQFGEQSNVSGSNIERVAGIRKEKDLSWWHVNVNIYESR